MHFQKFFGLYSTTTNREIAPESESLFTEQPEQLIQPGTSWRIVREGIVDTDTMEVEIGPTVPSEEPEQDPLKPREDPPGDHNVEVPGEPTALQDSPFDPI